LSIVNEETGQDTAAGENDNGLGRLRLRPLVLTPGTLFPVKAGITSLS
jgi:hypothetical protein